MEAEEIPNVLANILQEAVPADPSLVNIWRGLGSTTLEAEQGRLRERFLDLAGKVISINELVGRENELTLFS